MQGCRKWGRIWYQNNFPSVFCLFVCLFVGLFVCLFVFWIFSKFYNTHYILLEIWGLKKCPSLLKHLVTVLSQWSSAAGCFEIHSAHTCMCVCVQFILMTWTEFTVKKTVIGVDYENKVHNPTFFFRFSILEYREKLLKI